VKKGQIRVVVHRADDLPRMDLNGKADPYVVLTYGDKKEKTKSCKNTLDPVWDHELFLDVEEFGENQIKIEVFDKDRLGKDELMGLTNVDVRRISKQGSLTEMWDNLIGAKKGRVMWSMTFTPAETESVPPPSSPPGPIQTPDPIQTPYKPTPSPYKEENPVKRTGEPPRPNLEQEMNSPQPDEELIRVKRDPQDYEEPIKAYKGGIPDTGSVPEFDPEKYKGAFSEPPAAVDQLGYMSRVMSGFLRVTVHKGEDLMDLDFGGKSDPYVVIKYASQINKSKTVKGSLNPEFEFSTGYVIEDDGPSELWIELFDKDIGKDESLGHVKFDIRALVSEGDKMATWATLQNAKRGRIQVSLDYSPSGYNDGPSVEEEIHPYIPQMPAGDSLGPAEDEFRKRSVATQGKIRLNLLYDERREELKVFVHEVAGLPGGHLKDPPDPQVKLYLMPGRKKKKTEVVKDCVDPKFDEEFDFSIDYDQLPKHEIKICVVDRKGMFSKSPVLGSKTISLNNPGLRQGLADWFTLEDGDEDSD